MSAGYLLGDDDPELRRLAAQHLVWSEASHGGWRRAPVRRGDRVLDVGCGPGFTTLEFADWVGEDGRVVGLDPSQRFIDHLAAAAEARGARHVASVTGTVESLPAEARFDVIHLRWVLCFLADPAGTITRLARHLAPGGRLVTLDYFNYHTFAVAPRIPEMAQVVAAVAASWRRSGGSLDVQGRTPSACADAGLVVSSVRQVSDVARPGEARWRWPESFLEVHLPRLVTDGLLDPETLASFWAGWRERGARDGTFLHLPPLLEVIAVRGCDRGRPHLAP